MTPRQIANQTLAQAFSKRWRTAPSQASMNLAAGSLEASSVLPSVGGTKVNLGRGVLQETYGDTLADAGFRMQDPPSDEEKEHETWAGDRDWSVLIDKGGNEWHQMMDGVVVQTGSLRDGSLRDFMGRKGQYARESNDAQSPDTHRTSPQSQADTNEPRFMRMAKIELARRRDLKCPDCGYMGLPAGDGLCPNCGGKLRGPQDDTPNVQDFAEMRRAIIAQVKEIKR